MPVGSMAKRHAKYRAWLRKHPALWRDLPDHKINKHEIVNAMKRDGVIAISTYWPDVKIGLHIDFVKTEDAHARWKPGMPPRYEGY